MGIDLIYKLHLILYFNITNLLYFRYVLALIINTKEFLTFFSTPANQSWLALFTLSVASTHLFHRVLVLSIRLLQKQLCIYTHKIIREQQLRAKSNSVEVKRSCSKWKLKESCAGTWTPRLTYVHVLYQVYTTTIKVGLMAISIKKITTFINVINLF